jgi:hypothetical protein
LDPILLLGLIIGVTLAAAFNYILNRAPGSVPEDYAIGPPGMEVRCDCCLNPLIVGGILVIALAIMSSSFESRTELYVVGLISFIIVSVAGILGRRRRYADWKDLGDVLERVVPSKESYYRRTPFDFDSPEEEDEDKSFQGN